MSEDRRINRWKRVIALLLLLSVSAAGCCTETAKELETRDGESTSDALQETENTLELLGNVYDLSATRLNLSGMDRTDVEKIMDPLSRFTNVEYVELIDADGNCGLALQDAWKIKQAVPNAFLHCSFDLFGEQVSTDAEYVELIEKDVGEEGIPKIRQALDLLTGCQCFVLDDCGISNETLAGLREEYRDRTKIVWRIWFAQKGSCRTDRTVIRYVYNLDNTNCSDLRYCEDAEFIDFGHNEYLSDCSWAENMPHLKAIILSGSLIDDLSPFSNCTDLEFLEIAYCSKVRDLSPLSSCHKLIMVNSSYTGISDLEPLDDLQIRQLCCVCSRISKAEQQRFLERHPDCTARFWGKQPYGYGWRYEKDGCTPTDYYARLQEVFHYPNAHDTLW